jgi:hypothetical protein
MSSHDIKKALKESGLKIPAGGVLDGTADPEGTWPQCTIGNCLFGCKDGCYGPCETSCMLGCSSSFFGIEAEGTEPGGTGNG